MNKEKEKIEFALKTAIAILIETMDLNEVLKELNLSAEDYCNLYEANYL